MLGGTFPKQRQPATPASHVPGPLIQKHGDQAFNEHSAHRGDIYSLFSHVWVKRIRFGGCSRQGGAGLLYLAQLLIRDDVKHDVIWRPEVCVCTWTAEADRERRETRTVMLSLARSHDSSSVQMGEEYLLGHSRRAKEGTTGETDCIP